MHERVDEWARQVTDVLRTGELAEAVVDREQRIADSIGRIIEALEDLVSPLDKFAGGRGGQGRGGQRRAAPLIPPIVELMLLRGMQDQVYDQTRALDGRAGIEAGERRSRFAELGLDQRALLRLGRQMAEELQDAPVPGPGLQEQDSP